MPDKAEIKRVLKLVRQVQDQLNATKFSAKAKNATAGNIATLDANGNISDSGVTFATTAQTNAMLDSIFGAAS